MMNNYQGLQLLTTWPGDAVNCEGQLGENWEEERTEKVCRQYLISDVPKVRYSWNIWGKASN